MSYRRRKEEAVSQERWLEWVDSNKSRLHSIGLPAAVYDSNQRWSEFVETGAVDPRPGQSEEFLFCGLERGQMRVLLDFLLTHGEEFVPAGAGLVGFLEERLRMPSN